MYTCVIYKKQNQENKPFYAGSEYNLNMKFDIHKIYRRPIYVVSFSLLYYELQNKIDDGVGAKKVLHFALGRRTVKMIKSFFLFGKPKKKKEEK